MVSGDLWIMVVVVMKTTTNTESEKLHNNHCQPAPKVLRPECKVPSALEEYLFDLQGFLVLRGALSSEEVAACNATLDELKGLGLPRNGWHGYVHREDHSEKRGISFQQIYESGPAFERLIDHPNWINYVSRFLGGHDTFDWERGPLFIDENFASLRGPGQHIGLHSGGHRRTKRTQFNYFDGRFHCGQINILVGLTDIGPGDGATIVIPGSHKSNIKHPRFDAGQSAAGEDQSSSAEGVEGGIEVHLAAGDAILFVDATCHGSATRVNEGDRRICVYRYSPSWGNFRWAYTPSESLLGRLSPFARSIVQPVHKSGKLTPPQGAPEPSLVTA